MLGAGNGLGVTAGGLGGGGTGSGGGSGGGGFGGAAIFRIPITGQPLQIIVGASGGGQGFAVIRFYF